MLGALPRHGVPADGELDPERIIAALEAHGVEYVIVGGFGAQAHGARHQTLDIDVVPSGTEENLERSAVVLLEVGARLRVGGMSDEEARELPVTLDAAAWPRDQSRGGPLPCHRVDARHTSGRTCCATSESNR